MDIDDDVLDDEDFDARPVKQETVVCKRKQSDGTRCGTEIELIPENLGMFRPDVPQLVAICPECGRREILTKAMSIPLVEEYFKDVVQEWEEEKAAEEEELELFPSETISKKVIDTLRMFGYSHKRRAWKQKLTLIEQFVHDLPQYQTPQGLHQFLVTMGIDPNYIPLIVQRVFSQQHSTHSPVQPPVPNYPATWGTWAGSQQQPPATYVGMMGYEPPHQPQQPPYPYAPPESRYVKPQAATRVSASGDEDYEIVDEELDANGKVISRTIRRPSKGSVQQPQNDPMQAIIQTVGLLKDIGAIGGSREEGGAAYDAQMAHIYDIITKQQESLYAMLAENPNSSSPSGRDDHIEVLVNRLQNQIDKLQSDLSESREELYRERERLMNERMRQLQKAVEEGGMAPSGDVDLRERRKMLSELSDIIDRGVSRLFDPVIEMQRQQAKLNAIMMARQLENADGVNPGSYTSVFSGDTGPSREEMDQTMNKWRKRQREIKNAVNTYKAIGSWDDEETEHIGDDDTHDD